MLPSALDNSSIGVTRREANCGVSFPRAASRSDSGIEPAMVGVEAAEASHASAKEVAVIISGRAGSTGTGSLPGV